MTSPAPLSPSAGIGLRHEHLEALAAQADQDNLPPVGFFEIHAENAMGGGLIRDLMERIAARAPLSVHGVGLSLGSPDGLDPAHLDRFVQVARDLDAVLVSEHLAWSRASAAYTNDLLPVPMTQDALAAVIANVDRVQQRLGRSILVENPSIYVAWNTQDMDEPTFLGALVDRTGCGLLLDLNNIVVSGHNLGYAPHDYLSALLERVKPQSIGEIHLAGHARNTTPSGEIVLIDDHGSAVSSGVWALLDWTLARVGPKPVLVEWDTHVPTLDVLLTEAARAARHLQASNPAQAA